MLAPALAAFALALALTPVVRLIARRIGAVAAPKADRWHTMPTAMLGGVAIFIALNAAYPMFLDFTRATTVVLGASAFLFIAGLIDDFVRAKPYQKLIAQVLGAAIVVGFGIVLPWTNSPTFNMAITIFWIVGITNAINLLDNMDGLAAGIAAIASIFLAINFQANDQALEATMLAMFAAALIGFLVYNSNPASIFMGDCGSMFIGFFLATASLLTAAGTSGRSRTLLPVLAVPVLVLFIPIFDTTLVTLLRKLSGRAASQGGLDHTSHRLVALGMSERHAVWMLYGFAALSGALAILMREWEVDVAIAVLAGFTVALTLLGVYLAGVKVYAEEELSAASTKPLVAFLVDLSYKRRVFEVLLDVVLIILAYYGAYALLFGPMSARGDWQLFLRTLPLVVFIKMVAFVVSGVYRGLWRYMSIDNLIDFAKGVVLGSVGSILAILFAYRFAGFSRTVFVIDALLLFVMVMASRMAFRLFRQILPFVPRAGRRVLIYGAGDGGELLMRELVNNRELRYAPVGFVDDDPRKVGKVLHGWPVFGGTQLDTICRRERVEEVLLSTAKFPPERLAAIRQQCEVLGVELKRMRIAIERMDSTVASPAGSARVR